MSDCTVRAATHHESVRRLVGIVTLVLVSATAALAAPEATKVSASQLKSSFKQSTGQKLVVNKRISYRGHYVAFDYGAPSIAKKARYGTFTVYLVTAADLETEVNELLADSHTGVLGKPAPGGIHWESGSTIHGDRFWLAKRQYGANVVLWWTTTSGAKKTDATFKRLHKALTKAVR